MRIAYVSSATIPSRTAYSIHVMKMCQAMVGEGHKVRLIARCEPSDKEIKVDDFFGYYGVSNGFDVVRLRIPGVEFSGKGWLYGPLAALSARSWQPELVYGRDIVGSYLSMCLAMPTIFESHYPEDRANRARRWLFSRLICHPQFRRLVVITESLRRYYEKSWPKVAGKVVVAPDGAERIAGELPNATLQANRERLQVGYVGHLYRGKGMEVVGELARLSPWADFHIVGGAADDIRYWRTTYKDAHNLAFHGFVSPSEVAAYIQAFDVVLLPNQPVVYAGKLDIGQWTSPLKAFEYMAAGKPILASDLPVLREVLEHERNSILCPHDDINAWSQALKRLKDNPALCVQLGTIARNDLTMNYTWSVRARRVLESVH